MKITDLSKEELESKSYDDIAYMILESSGEKVKITDLFKQICDLLGLSNEEYEAKIADFFQILSTDHRFIMLEKGFWDLRSRHQAKIIIEDDGVGFDKSTIPTVTRNDNSGFGLSMMKERIYLLSGKLEIISKPGEGCETIVTVPVKKEDN